MEIHCRHKVTHIQLHVLMNGEQSKLMIRIIIRSTARALG